MKKNILWVDDQVNTMALLPDRDALEFKGYTIIPVTKVDDFLKIIRDGVHKIDCVIVDMLMATGSLDIKETEKGTRTGLVLIKEMKESCYKDVPAVVYSVFESEEDIVNFCKEEGILYLNKTIKAKEFADNIDKVLKKKYHHEKQ